MSPLLVPAATAAGAVPGPSPPPTSSPSSASSPPALPGPSPLPTSAPSSASSPPAATARSARSSTRSGQEPGVRGEEGGAPVRGEEGGAPVRAVDGGEEGGAPVQKFADRISKYFVPLVIILSFATWFTWFLAGRLDAFPKSSIPSSMDSFQLALQFGISAMVIACPCALADRPLEGKRWWLGAEDPFQCLAVCINLAEALRSSSPETTISYLPVHQMVHVMVCSIMQRLEEIRKMQSGKQLKMLDLKLPSQMNSPIKELFLNVTYKSKAVPFKLISPDQLFAAVEDTNQMFLNN